MKKPPVPIPADKAEPYVMRIADNLSDDPALLSLLGERFKVLVDYDAERRRVTYSFRCPEDDDPREHDAKPV